MRHQRFMVSTTARIESLAGIVSDRPVFSNLFSTVERRFLDYLANRSVRRVDICRIDTDICVIKCVVDLFEDEIEPVVLADYCGSTAGKQAHMNALQTLGRFNGCDQVR